MWYSIMHFIFILITILYCSQVIICNFPNEKEQEKNKHPDSHLRQQTYREWQKLDNLFKGKSEEKLKNIILFIGDGMGVTTITAARYFRSHIEKEPLGTKLLFMESLDFSGLLRTYSNDSIVSDSAAAATALFTGAKCKNKVLGYDYKADFDRCSSKDTSKEQQSFLVKAKKMGFNIGVVTTTRLTHSTIAATYAHSVNRHYENYTVGHCRSIADQFTKKIHIFDVIAGGGLDFLREKTETMRLNLKSREKTFMFVDKYNFTKLSKNMHEVDTVLALLSDSHLPFQNAHKSDDLSLGFVTRTVLSILEKKSIASPGYILIVEGGRIDHGNHLADPSLALSETLALDDAVKLVAEKVLPVGETLVIVTADHSSGLNINPGSRNVDLLEYSDSNFKSKTRDNRSFYNLVYTSGPQTVQKKLGNISGASNASYDRAFIPMKLGMHGGEDVVVFASGPGSYLFTGVHDNTYVAHTIERLIGFNKMNHGSKSKPLLISSMACLLGFLHIIFHRISNHIV